MSKIFYILFLSISLFACLGDCMLCHQSLLKNINNDKDHQPMLLCKNCHATVAQSNKMSSCGGDCWQCHNPQKVANSGVKEHTIIESSCIRCHDKKGNRSLDAILNGHNFEVPDIIENKNLLIDVIKQSR